MNYLTILLMAALSLTWTYLAAYKNATAHTRPALGQDGEVMARKQSSGLLLIGAFLLITISLAWLTGHLSLGTILGEGVGSMSVGEYANTE